MTHFEGLRIFAAIVANSLVSRTKTGGALPQGAARSSSSVPPGFIPVSPDAISLCLADPGKAADERGEIRLFFTGAPALAAPFLLFRLKRLGFSGCRAEARKGGVALTARR